MNLDPILKELFIRHIEEDSKEIWHCAGYISYLAERLMKRGYAIRSTFVQKCPICLGCGNVPGGFYTVTVGHIEGWTSASTSEMCRACNGKGVI